MNDVFRPKTWNTSRTCLCCDALLRCGKRAASPVTRGTRSDLLQPELHGVTSLLTHSPAHVCLYGFKVKGRSRYEGGLCGVQLPELFSEPRALRMRRGGTGRQAHTLETLNKPKSQMG